MTGPERIEIAELRRDLMGRFDSLDSRLRSIEQQVAVQRAVGDRLDEIESDTRATRRWLVGLVLSGSLALGGFLLRVLGA